MEQKRNMETNQLNNYETEIINKTEAISLPTMR
jgi:hypothetical protein